MATADKIERLLTLLNVLVDAPRSISAEASSKRHSRMIDQASSSCTRGKVFSTSAGTCAASRCRVPSLPS